MDSGQGSFNRRQEADDLTDYVNNGWLSSAEFDGPTFLWNHLIREASQEDAAQRNDVPVANLSDADVVITEIGADYMVVKRISTVAAEEKEKEEKIQTDDKKDL